MSLALWVNSCHPINFLLAACILTTCVLAAYTTPSRMESSPGLGYFIRSQGPDLGVPTSHDGMCPAAPRPVLGVACELDRRGILSYPVYRGIGPLSICCFMVLDVCQIRVTSLFQCLEHAIREIDYAPLVLRHGLYHRRSLTSSWLFLSGLVPCLSE